MELIFENEFITIEFDSTINLLISTIKKNEDARVVVSEDLVSGINMVAEKIIEKRPDYVINNSTQSTYTYSDEEQQFISKVLGEASIKGGVKKYALVISNTDIFVEVSHQQTLTDATNMPFEMEYFSDLEEALKWLGV